MPLVKRRFTALDKIVRQIHLDQTGLIRSYLIYLAFQACFDQQ